ncbi:MULTISPECIES: molybdate ABC transporter substrate-binding protein [unclassified Luteimonas]|uniref:molybdate ABC transporter substrate-binding protein n=1 Tax=unclassified Luteimonas TaxID=2629088 RepID=UPI0018F0ADE2|nr:MULTISPECIES: molybdate ABC transporter substrate-binding protein [unclassified Luteimonas]MBJ6980293.1 molybdate ABC transporter substrate-binding protein [Luteimonas sp. MC1895]MBJ6983231.1 molybdate ABC transporter substrate-binding protein [Luteimonas sp. MC1750]QQO05504.1 molybdate ABC transporter substrate-binding protein [Luteimonas sp. MC1750]
MPPIRRLVLAALAALTLLLGVAAGPARADDAPLTVFAAASLKESMDEAADAYRRATGQRVRVSYAASSALARQIAQGAPADVFIPADSDWMDELQARGLVDAETRTALLGNSLVLIAPATSATAPLALRTGVDLRPLLGQRGRIAMGMVDSVPAGRYAKAGFLSLGMWDALAPRVAGVENVRAALMLVARGEAPLGVVYDSDARAEPRVRVLATFPAGSHPGIVYPAARVSASRHARAAAFIDWLRTPPAQAIFARRGFRLL